MAEEEKTGKFACPLLDIVYKTMWVKVNRYVRRFLDRTTEAKVNFKLVEYTLYPNESGILTLTSIANKYDIVLGKIRPRFQVNSNNYMNKLMIRLEINDSEQINQI